MQKTFDVARARSSSTSGSRPATSWSTRRSTAAIEVELDGPRRGVAGARRRRRGSSCSHRPAAAGRRRPARSAAASASRSSSAAAASRAACAARRARRARRAHEVGGRRAPAARSAASTSAQPRATSRRPDVAGGVNVKSASGDIARSARSAAARTSRPPPATSSSRSCAAPSTSTTASGDVTIGEAYDNVTSNTVSGDQEHARGHATGASRAAVGLGRRRRSASAAARRSISTATPSAATRPPSSSCPRDAPARRRPAGRDPGEDRQRRHQDHAGARARRRPPSTGAGGARMNRLSWDTTAPRRPNGKRHSAQPRPEDSAWSRRRPS